MSFAEFLPVFIAVAVLVGLAVAAMIVSQRLSGRCLQGGTCGSRAIHKLRGPNGESLSCATCPNRRPDVSKG
jgi:hypothetical protein